MPHTHKETIKHLHENGFTHIPNVFSKDEINFIRAETLNSLTLSSEEKNYKEGGRILRSPNNEHHFPSIMFWPCLINPYLNQIRTNKRLAQIVEAALGSNLKQLNNQIYFRLPGDSDSFSWHQDIMFRKPLSEQSKMQNSYLQTLIIVDEFMPDNGAIEFICGSHKLGNLDLVPSDKTGLHAFNNGELPPSLHSLEKKTIYPKPGDLIIWYLLTVHGSPQNNSNQSRMTYMNGFCKADATENWPHYMREGIVCEDIDHEKIPYTDQPKEK